MDTTTTTTRLDGIINRNKRGLVRDLVAAVMLAGCMVGAIGALRFAWQNGPEPTVAATKTEQVAEGCMLVQVCPTGPASTIAN